MFSKFTNVKLMLQEYTHFISLEFVIFSLPFPHINDVPRCEIRDEHWFPMDSQVHYELVPLNPKSDLFQATTANVIERISDIKIVDVFRIQNSFLLQKYKL